MKKQYISPDTTSMELFVGDVLLKGSPIKVDSNTENPIPVGEDATSGGSDSRRRQHDIWDDEMEEEDY